MRPDPAAAARAPLILETDLLGPLAVPESAQAEGLAELSARAAVYATRAKGEGTRRAYRTAWQGFVQWCASLGRDPLGADPDTIAMYVVRRADAGRAVSTIRVDLAAILTAHRLAGLTLDLRHPRLAMVLEGVTRSLGVRPRRQAAPAVPDLLRRLLATRPAPTTPLGARDRALLLLGFGAALRRSELVGLRLGDVVHVPGKGLLLTVRRSKTDQAGAGQQVAVCANPAEPGFCPAAALEAWLGFRGQGMDLRDLPPSGMNEKPLFCGLTKGGKTITGAPLSDKAVARLVKQAASDAGLDAAKFSGHSLRAGLATAAGDAGADLPALMRQTRHKSTAVALSYLRPAELWRHNVTAAVFQADRAGKGG